MNAQLFRRLFRQNILWLIILPALTAVTAFYFTRNQTQTYQATATLYTGLASGYSILTDDRNTRIDHQAVDNAFDNLLATINSRETMTQVGTHLLARHLLLERPDPLVLGNAGFGQLQRSIPASLRTALTAGRNEQLIYWRLDSLAHSTSNNPVKRLLNSSSSWYSPARISKELQATRKKDSDMLELTYKSEDAAVTFTTLTELIDVFSKRYAGFKSSETNPVVGYYSKQNRLAGQKLEQAEMRLKGFEETNKIIDYDAESKGMAATKEDIANQYNEELMRFRAAKASLDVLGKRLDDRMSVLKTNDELISKRTELTAVTSQLAQATVYGRSRETIGQLSAKVAQLSEELKTAALNYYKVGNTIESLPQAHLLDEWLSKLLLYEESTARVNAFEKRLGEFNSMAAKFTPLGSTLTQLKRDISVAEREYMTTLSGLRQAQTRQKNAEMTGPLRLLDAPEFPLQALPSKRGMVIGAALGVGVVLALIIALLRYLTDGRLYDSGRFELVTGLSVIASFPTVYRRMRNKKVRAMAQYMLEQLRSTAAIDMMPMPDYRPYTLITVWSTRPKQGKTWLTSQLAERYGLAGKRVAYLHPHPISNTLTFPEEVTSIAYEVRSDFAYAKRVDQLVDKHSFNPEHYDIILVELPDLSETPIATHLVTQSSLLLLVVSARSTWGSHDQNLYQLYRKAATAPILPVLNHVSPTVIEVSPPAKSSSSTSRSVPESTPEPAVIVKKETV